MSLYQNISERNIMNVAKQTPAIDVSTRNPFYGTIVGYEAAPINVGKYNSVFGYQAAKRIKRAERNTIIGANAGFNLNNDDNIIIGTYAAYNLSNGVQNVCIGNNAMNNLNSDNNVYIGFNNTFDTFTHASSSNNTSIGTITSTLGYFNNVIGYNNDVISYASIIYGNNIYDRSSNSILVGNHIKNNASKSLIINTLHTESNPLINQEEGYFNIQDKLISSLSNNLYLLSVQDDTIRLKAATSEITLNNTITLATSNSTLNFGDVITLGNSHVKLHLDDFAYLGKVNSNAYINIKDDIMILTQFGKIDMNSNNVKAVYNNSSLLINDDLTLSNAYAGLIISSNINIITQSSNSLITMDSTIQANSSYGKLILGSNYNWMFLEPNNSIYMEGTTLCNTTDIIINNAESYFNSNISILGKLRFGFSNHSDHHWDMFLINDYATSNASDLMFRSKNGTTITWTDDFYPEVLNFTGKHRCFTEDSSMFMEKYIGCIVRSTGKYRNLDDDECIFIDESIPIVELVTKANDPAAFGVVSDFEPGDKREYRLGNMIFGRDINTTNTKSMRVIINAVGEGAIWVCNVNGKLKNGDFITSSSILGYGMRQNTSIVRNYTVAKITCDCTFDLNSTIYTCKEFTYDGKLYKKALVGCTYKL